MSVLSHLSNFKTFCFVFTRMSFPSSGHEATTVKLHFPSVAALRKSFFVLGLSQVCPICLSVVLFSLFYPKIVLMLPLFCPELALESAHDFFDVPTMTFFSTDGCGQGFERFTKRLPLILLLFCCETDNQQKQLTNSTLQSCPELYSCLFEIHDDLPILLS